jgi:hypothetical protein
MTPDIGRVAKLFFPDETGLLSLSRSGVITKGLSAIVLKR